MRHDICNSLRDLLENESAALLEGRIDQVARKIKEKQRLADALGSVEVKPEDLAALGRLATRNAELLRAARRGIQAALAELAGKRGNGAPLDTYDRRGQRNSVAPARTNLTHRA